MRQQWNHPVGSTFRDGLDFHRKAKSTLGNDQIRALPLLGGCHRPPVVAKHLGDEILAGLPVDRS